MAAQVQPRALDLAARKAESWKRPGCESWSSQNRQYPAPPSGARLGLRSTAPV